MCKLQAGAYGTLSALTELTVKVMPKPETACTIVLHGLADDVAIPALANALNSPFEVSGAAHLAGDGRAPFEARRRCRGCARRRPLCGSKARGHRSPIAPTRSKRCSGAARVSTMRRRRPCGARSARFAISHARIPHRLAALSDAKRLLHGRAFDTLHAGVGGIPVRLGRRTHLAERRSRRSEAGDDGGAAIVRAAVKSAGGHAALIVAPEAVRASMPVFEPLEGGLAETYRPRERRF